MSRSHLTIDDSCWICGHEATTRLPSRNPIDTVTPDDLRISDKRYGLTLPLVRCDRCGFVFAAREHLPALTSLYSELDDAEYGASAEGRRRQMAHLLQWAAGDLPRGSRLLDVGAASGLLVREATARGLECVGVEPSRPLAAAARADGLDVRDGVLPQPSLTGATFDIVTLVDVIEHVDDPLALLRQCRSQLGPGARLLVVTPDRASIAARVLRGRWWHRRIAHVGYFDRATLTDALRRTGFEPQRWTHPRWYLPAGYLFTRALQYVPIVRDRASRGDGGGRLIVPFNLFDSLAVVARAS